MNLYRGIVVENNSPTRDGRVQVRIPVIHGDFTKLDIDVYDDSKCLIKNADLPWAEVMQGIDYIGYHRVDNKFDQNEKQDTIIESGRSLESHPPRYKDGVKHPGLGRNTIIEKGTWVFCVLDHDNPNMPIVIGCIASHNEINPRSNPLNQVRETVSGHLEEWDDNPGNERIRFHHRTGSDFEFEPDGDTDLFVAKNHNLHTLGSNFELIDKDRVTNIGGNRTEVTVGTTIVQAEMIFLN